MKFIKLDLLTLLISLFIFSSCENPSTIGLEIDPSNTLQGTLVDTVTIISRTIKDENTSTTQLAKYPFGLLNDPIFGTTESSISMTINLPNEGYSFGNLPILDSAVLAISYGSDFYGDSTLNYSVDVHQLASGIDDEDNLLSNKSYPIQSFLVGNKTGKIFPTTPLKILDIVSAKKDTLKTVSPQIRVKLDQNFIQENIVNLLESALKTNNSFRNRFKGLQIQINKTGFTGSGGIMFFDFETSKSNLILYYKKQNATTPTAVDTVSVNFPIITQIAPVAASIKHDYKGTAIEIQLNNPNQQYAVTYLQPLAGLKNKISFPYLTKFAAEAGKIIINKAELVIDLSSGTDITPFAATPRLALYKYDIAEKRKNLIDNNQGFSNRALDPVTFGGYFNAVKKQYVFVITSHIQDLVTGKAVDYGTFLAPTPLNEFQYLNPSLTTGARAVIGSFKKNAAVGDNTMKLNIYYTKIN